MATMTGDLEAAAAALGAGAEVNHVNEHGLTPLHVVSGGVGPAAMMDLLIKAGADVNAPDNTGWTCLVLVSSTGIVPLLELLLAAGADVNWRTGSASPEPILRSPVDASPTIESDAGTRTSITASTTGGGGVGGSKLEKSWTPLTRAAFRGQAKAVARLLQAGSDPENCFTDGKTAAQLAHQMGHAEVLTVLADWPVGGQHARQLLRSLTQ